MIHNAYIETPRNIIYFVSSLSQILCEQRYNYNLKYLVKYLRGVIFLKSIKWGKEILNIISWKNNGKILSNKEFLIIPTTKCFDVYSCPWDYLNGWATLTYWQYFPLTLLMINAPSQCYVANHRSTRSRDRFRANRQVTFRPNMRVMERKVFSKLNETLQGDNLLSCLV